ncbi:MAG TPA: ABC transporter substrate-binding protein, partial [Ktedonobacterales bacterium]
MRRPRHRLPLCLPLLASLAALLAGCSLPGVPGGPTGPAALPDAQQVFRPLDVATKGSNLASLDPALIEFQSDYNLAQLIFPPLVTLDEHNQVVPWTAQRWETSADGLTWTFHLRPGMKWSDGVPIDASTYAYSLNRSLDPCTESGVAYYLTGQDSELIKDSMAFRDRLCPQGATVAPDTLIGKSLIVGDAQTLIILLSHPAAYLPAALTYSTAWAQPRQLIERYGEQWTDHLGDDGGFGGNLFTVRRWEHPAGRSTSAQHGTASLVLRRNEAFWGTKAKLREIDWSLYPSQSLLWNDFTAGFGDSASPDAIELGEARTMPGFHQDPGLAIAYLAPNLGAPPFNDLRVRQALSLALDRTALAQLSPYPRAPTVHIVPQGMPGYNPDLKDPAVRTGDTALRPDVARARELWQSYVADKCGGDAAKCPKIGVQYRAGVPDQAAAANLYIQQWQAAMPGLRVT